MLALVARYYRTACFLLHFTHFLLSQGNFSEFANLIRTREVLLYETRTAFGWIQRDGRTQ